MLQPVIQQLSNYFLQPLGLVALLALIPLIIFYLMRPSPEEKVMPSMKFFQQDKKSGRLQKALKILQRNMMLLFHILMVAGLAAAIANPFMMAEERPENAVVVIDNSASMQPVFDQVKMRAVSELGMTNTVVLANDDAEVVQRSVSLSAARSFIQDLEVEETGSSLGRAVERGSNYRGKMFIASDFDNTASSQVKLNPLLESLSASRPLVTFNPQKTNKWGIVDLKTSENNSTAFIQNFKDKSVTTSFKVEEDSRELQLDSGELRKVSFTLENGKNTVELDEDGFEVDNKAYVMKPGSQDVQVTVIADKRNRYLMKALELVDKVEARHVSPSDELPESDVYVIGKISSPDDLKARQIGSRVKDGGGLILYAQKGVKDFKTGEWPVSSVGERFNSTVSVSRPVDLELENLTLFRSEVEGEAAADPEEALKFSKLGDGTFVYFNFASERFREDLMYPVFWKQLIMEVGGKASMTDLNRKSGETVLTEERAIELSETGFREVEGRNYAVNLLNGDESSFEDFKGSYDSVKTVKKPRSLQAAPLLVIIVLGLAELSYLWRKGEIP